MAFGRHPDDVRPMKREQWDAGGDALDNAPVGAHFQGQEVLVNAYDHCNTQRLVFDRSSTAHKMLVKTTKKVEDPSRPNQLDIAKMISVPAAGRSTTETDKASESAESAMPEQKKRAAP